MIRSTRLSFLFIIILHFFAGKFFSQNVFDAARKGDTLAVLALMKINPDTIQKTDKNGFSPLILACYHGQTLMAGFLIRHHSKIDFVSPEGTALMAVVYKNELALAEKLLLLKANPDLSNDLGTTALMLAVSGNQKNMVELLLKYHCNKNMKDHEGRTALQISRATKNQEIIDLLEKAQ